VRVEDTNAELDCARDTLCRQENALIDKEREICQKLEAARAQDWCKIRHLNSEM